MRQLLCKTAISYVEVNVAIISVVYCKRWHHLTVISSVFFKGALHLYLLIYCIKLSVV